MDDMCTYASVWNIGTSGSTAAGLITDDYVVLKLNPFERRNNLEFT